MWVFGIVDTSFVPARGFMTVVPNRSAATLKPIIQHVVRPGTIIHSDEWRSYNNLKVLGFEHHTVNHSVNFVEPVTGVHTQNIESYWAKNKRRCKNMKGIKREFLQDYLNEYMWRDNIVEDCFEKTLELIRDFYE